MLLREEGDGVVLCIGQPAHAWLSGQLARAWADPVEPREEVCLAADQHDAGMAAWDADPELNTDTGLPYSFIEMPLATHMRLWSAAPSIVLPQSRYASLLVSMHGTALYERRDLDRMEPADADAVRRYLSSQRAYQDELIESLGADRDEVRRNQRLLWIWDSVSLGLCLRWEGHSVEGLTIGVRTLDPWPFRDDQVTLRTEGRILRGRFSHQEEMRTALRAAQWRTLEFRLSAR